MLLFWLLASLMILAALLLVVPPLMRDRTSGRDSMDEANVALYRERLTELDRERDRGEIEADRYSALREDIERGLLADVGGREAPRTTAHPPPYWMAVTVAVAVPVCGLAFYLWLGSPHGLHPQSPPPEADAGTEPTQSVEAMVASLAARLASDPANAEGWLLLARSQVALERFTAALVAFERAHALLGDDPSPSIVAAASDIATRLGFETMAMNLPLTAKPAQKVGVGIAVGVEAASAIGIALD